MWAAVKKEALILCSIGIKHRKQHGCEAALGQGPSPLTQPLLLLPLALLYAMPVSSVLHLACSALLWRDSFGISAQPGRCMQSSVEKESTLSEPERS